LREDREEREERVEGFERGTTERFIRVAGVIRLSVDRVVTDLKLRVSIKISASEEKEREREGESRVGFPLIIDHITTTLE